MRAVNVILAWNDKRKERFSDFLLSWKGEITSILRERKIEYDEWEGTLSCRKKEIVLCALAQDNFFLCAVIDYLCLDYAFDLY